MPSLPRARAARSATRAARPRIYCAGPLFTPHERAEMAAIAESLAQAGFGVFLPHRDGFVFADVYAELLRGGYERDEAAPMVQRAIFWLDAYEVLAGCQGLVFNLNGRVPDEGGVAEAAMAFTAGLPVVLYKDDSRSAIQGYDNPLVSGLGGFVRVATVPEIPYAFTQLFRSRPRVAPALSPALRPLLARGRRFSRALAHCKSTADITSTVVAAVREAGPAPR